MPAAPQSRPAAVFVTGGTGKVARQLAPLLAGPFASEPIPVLLGSRSGGTPDASRYAGVAFDWGNPSSWRPALAQLRELAAANSNKGDFYDDDDHTGPATAVFLIVPSIVEPGGMVSAFIDLAREKANARRFVLLSASLIEDGGPAMGQVHRGLRERGEKGEIEWAVLRPTWFQENFSEQMNHLRSIREESRILSATGAGRIPWVATEDIAAMGHYTLTVSPAPNRDFLVLGPELLTYDDLAQIFTSVLGRRIAYHELTADELSARHQSFGMPPPYAAMLAAMDTVIRQGGEDRINDDVLRLTGRQPRPFRAFVERNRAVWAPHSSRGGR